MYSSKSTWSDDAYRDLSNSYKGKPKDDVFINNKKGAGSPDMSPIGVAFRECRDSVQHPEVLAVFFAMDETGSMGDIPYILVTEKLGALMTTLTEHNLDCAVLFAGIGDHESDKYPLQVGQFESGTAELNHWLTSVYLERNGGGNGGESYLLAWLFAARHTVIDCFAKRGTKGILFTVGDERCLRTIDAHYLKKVMGYDEAATVTDKQLLEEARMKYEVYHIHVRGGTTEDGRYLETNHANDSSVLNYWRDLLGQNLIILDDFNNLAETVAATIAVHHGIALDAIMSKFDDKTKAIVGNAVSNLPAKAQKASSGVFNL